MRDVSKLRDQLRRALVCAPLAFPLASCATATTPRGGGDGSQATGNEQGVRDALPSGYVAWPVSIGGCGQGGRWCGPLEQVTDAARASGESAEAASACPRTFWHEGFGYSLVSPDAGVATDESADGPYFPDGLAGGAEEQGLCCYYFSDGCTIGRPLLDGTGRARVAPVREVGRVPPVRVVARGLDDALPDDLRRKLADGWLEDALLEHASVASFARAALELMAVGAPPDLLADCFAAGLDEVRHAEACFGLAARYSGRRRVPGPLPVLPVRIAELARLAVDTFEEGCVAETIAVLAASRVRAVCRDAEVGDVLDRIIADEARHAELAWRTVAWAARAGGAEVALAVRARARVLASEAALGADSGEPDAEMLAQGRPDEATRRAAVRDGWAHVIDPTLDDVLGPCATA